MNGRRLVFLVMAVSALVALQNGLGAEEQLTATQIMEKTEEQNKARDRTDVMTMEIVRGESRRVRTLRRWARTDENGNSKSLIRFLSPAEVKGTGFLTIEYSDRNDDLWLYLPALKKTRRIASSKRSGSFMGSDFAYADMGSGNSENYIYVLTGTEEIEGKECFVIAAVPMTEKVEKEEGYSRRVYWIRTDIFFPVQQRLFDRKGNYVKQMISTDIRKNEETGIWYALSIVMENEQKEGHRTIITFDEVTMNTDIPDSLFTQRSLTKER